MEFTVLGPLEVRDEGLALPLPRGKPRALLAVLLLNANEIVPTDRLVEALWSAPPDTARKALQVYVARLRTVLEPGREHGGPPRLLLTRPPGYLLQIEPDQLDAWRFEQLLEQARTSRADGPGAVAALLREALSLWRGAALAEFAYEPFAQSEIARLEGLRVAALEDRLDADLELGAHASVIGELETLVRSHPLRERFRGQLMLALYRAGRQAEALEVYQHAYRTLSDELGIAPGPALRRLQEHILSQAAQLDSRPAPVAVPLPRDRPPRPTRATVTAVVVGRPPQPVVDPEARPDDNAAIAAIERHGGSLAGVLGDRVAGVFGFPRLHEDDALRAARAAFELLGATGTVGVATGELVTADAGAPGALVGNDPVAHAAALEGSAPIGCVMLDHQTRTLLGQAVRAEPLAEGDDPPWRLVELLPPRPALSTPPDRSLIGRENELARLGQALDHAARERTVHLFTILGAAGIGKSRLVEEFARGVEKKATVLAGRCVPYGEGITFWPLREVVDTLTATVPLPELLADEDDASLVLARVDEAVGGHEAASSLEEIFWGFRRVLEALARTRPVVLVIEDLHWAEPGLLDLLDHVAERSRTSPLLIVCLARPELLESRPGWGGGKRNSSALELEPLSRAESERLVDTIGAAVPDAVRAQVLETAEGNPLFLEQIVAMIAEGTANGGALRIPPTIQAVLAARLDRLGPGERVVIACASVLGRELSCAALADLLPEAARPFASRHLEALVDRDLLVPVGPDARRFGHVLIQQTAYGMIPKRERARLHERAAAWLEQRAGLEPAGAAERAGHHLEQAYHHLAELGTPREHAIELARRAARLLTSAGRAAFRRGDMPAAANLMQRAVALHPTHDRDRLALMPDLGYALFEIGELERATRILSETTELARASGARGVAWHASMKLAHARMYTDPGAADPERLARTCRRAIAELDRLDDQAGLARAWSLAVDVAWARGRMVEAAEAAERAAVHARAAHSPRDEAWGLGASAFAHLLGPTPVPDAIRTTARLLDEASGSTVLESNLTGFLAALTAMSGRFDAARVLIGESLDRLQDLGLTWQAAVQQLLGGHIEMLAGDAVRAEGHFRTALSSFGRIGDRWFAWTTAVDLARALLEQRRDADARAAVAAIPELPGGADREVQIKRHGIEGRLLAGEGRVDAAVRSARDGVIAAEGTDLVWFHADALTDLADVLSVAGRRDEAVDAARAALALHDLKHNVASARRVRLER